ncbi:MAG: hypothetical protein M1818_000581 [Claussenomyces sp. TS43310]|nr:MAG: hypothetical protein M1818_000581 [Claussenomyces sp. TS43310]
MEEMKDGHQPPNVKGNGSLETVIDGAKVKALEDRIVALEAALKSLLEDAKPKVAESHEKDTPSEAKDAKPILTDEESCLPRNWTRRFQWRRENNTRNGEEYFVIESPYQDTDRIDKSQISLVHDEDLRGAPERVLIKSFKIQSKLREIPGIETFEEVRLNLNSVEIHSPFSPLFHYIEQLKKAVDSDETSTVFDKADMHALSMFCSQGPVGSMFQDIRRLIEQGLITAEQQWALLRPGILVIIKVLGEIEVLRVKSIVLEDSRRGYYGDERNGDRYIICTQIAWNGKSFGEREREIRLQKFPGSKRLVELDVCPLDSFPEDERTKILAATTHRGKVWKELCESPNAIPKDCDTRCLPLLSESRGYWDPFTGEERRSEPVETRISGRVIVDPQASAKASKLGTMTETFTLSTSEIEPFTPEFYWREDISTQYLRCGALIEVFSLSDHKWYRVPVLNLTEPEWKLNPWEHLELSSERKQLLRTLVNAHEIRDKRSEDLIEKKGKGLVFLFHGQPGLEALSESISRPLYRINIGLLAMTDDWEPALEQIFRDAHSWRAVLLFDEAEVVMEARTKDRMHQNSWCSAFLRKLEYYEGILILTTNMIHSIDKAFRSRINIAIHYDDLTLHQKTSLWRLFIQKLHPERCDTAGLLRRVDMWAQQNLNGRQIRNVVLTAEALALGESKYLKMNADHIERIIRDTQEFNQAIENEKKRKSTLKVGSVPPNW